MADDAFVPAFPGQRPPFEVGNMASLRHGARSERVLGPLADRIVDDLLADPSTPDYLRDPSFGPSLLAWGRAEASVHLLADFISQVGMVKALAGRGMLLEQLRRWETTAANLRARLGLDPESRAKLMRDLSAARYMSSSDALSLVLDRIADERAVGDGRDGV